MRCALLILFLLIVTPAHAAKMRCTGFAFITVELECVTSDPPVKAASFCDVMNRQGGPIRWSRSDTDGTKDRADLVNAVGKRLCGWGRQ